ncbi:Saccharopine dehydrogenase [Ceratocystis pirilliformis]|uniref:Saccharopine dehydrogenase [NAD(+), L-lysine-forming] n=1 Tax=Ceratocystis pirilliformis TaxID=259994 RepID=A0ABR3ZKB5_9PEZI
MSTTLHLRAETKPLEHRSALTPNTTKALIADGYTVNVERCSMRVFDDKEFEEAGATLVPTGSWTEAPADHIIIGLKELPEETFPLKHTHVQFAHCYKEQGGWKEVLARFPRGGGTLLDLEFLTHENGRRVAAFGYHAGFAGAAASLIDWAWQINNPGKSMPALTSYPIQDRLITDVKAALAEGSKKAGRQPRVIIIGALGRCGTGAVDMVMAAGIPAENILKWDIAETKAGGPFTEIVESDIFINCIYLAQKIPNFVDLLSLQSPKRKLTVICDVSADTTSPYNPVPVYNVATTFSNPTVPVTGLEGEPLTVIAIDHLPSLLPREASEAFSNDLLPHLLKLKEWKNDGVWARANALFESKVATLPAEALKN